MYSQLEKASETRADFDWVKIIKKRLNNLLSSRCFILIERLSIKKDKIAMLASS